MLRMFRWVVICSSTVIMNRFVIGIFSSGDTRIDFDEPDLTTNLNLIVLCTRILISGSNVGLMNFNNCSKNIQMT